MQHVNYNVKYYENPVITDRRINNSGLFNSGVRAVASAIYELYFNTRKASSNNKDFYDKKRNDYYIIYKNDAIHSLKCFSFNAINKAKKLLKSLGLIKIIPQKWNQPDRIYLTDFTKVYKSVTNNEQNFRSTDSKMSGQSSAKSHKNKTSKTKFKNNIIKTNNTRRVTENQQQINKHSERDLKSMLHDTIVKTNLTRIPEQIADASSNDPSFFHHIFRLFLNAKISVRRDIKNTVGKSSKIYKQAKKALTFEKNIAYYEESDIAKSVYWIIRKAYKTAFNYHDKYIMKSFKKLFNDAVKLYKINHTKANKNDPKIPLITIK